MAEKRMPLSTSSADDVHVEYSKSVELIVCEWNDLELNEVAQMRECLNLPSNRSKESKKKMLKEQKRKKRQNSLVCQRKPLTNVINENRIFSHAAAYIDAVAGGEIKSMHHASPHE